MKNKMKIVANLHRNSSKIHEKKLVNHLMITLHSRQKLSTEQWKERESKQHLKLKQ